VNELYNLSARKTGKFFSFILAVLLKAKLVF